MNGIFLLQVSVCAGCNVIYPWGACIVGTIAGIAYHLWSFIVRKLKVDDPLDAVAGKLLFSFFSILHGVLTLNNRIPEYSTFIIHNFVQAILPPSCVFYPFIYDFLKQTFSILEFVQIY